MLTLLQGIFYAVASSPFLVADELVAVFNLFIVGIAALAATIIALLPDFPAPPGPPSGVLGWLSWLLPLGAMTSGFAVLVTCWVTFLGIKVVLKWVKAL